MKRHFVALFAVLVTLSVPGLGFTTAAPFSLHMDDYGAILVLDNPEFLVILEQVDLLVEGSKPAQVTLRYSVTNQGPAVGNQDLLLMMRNITYRSYPGGGAAWSGLRERDGILALWNGAPLPPSPAIRTWDLHHEVWGEFADIYHPVSGEPFTPHQVAVSETVYGDTVAQWYLALAEGEQGTLAVTYPLYPANARDEFLPFYVYHVPLTLVGAPMRHENLTVNVASAKGRIYVGSTFPTKQQGKAYTIEVGQAEVRALDISVVQRSGILFGWTELKHYRYFAVACFLVMNLALGYFLGARIGSGSALLALLISLIVNFPYLLWVTLLPAFGWVPPMPYFIFGLPAGFVLTLLAMKFATREWHSHAT